MKKKSYISRVEAMSEPIKQAFDKTVALVTSLDLNAVKRLNALPLEEMGELQQHLYADPDFQKKIGVLRDFARIMSKPTSGRD